MIMKWIRNIFTAQDPSDAQDSARYWHLEDLLAAGNWQEADQETAKVMLAVANRTEQGWLDIPDIDNFPCEDLRAIDGLWVKYSNGKFGFSVQKRIYQSLGGIREYYNHEVWNSFTDRVGWLNKKGWRNVNLNFSNKAPEGHLPIRIWCNEDISALFNLFRSHQDL